MTDYVGTYIDKACFEDNPDRPSRKMFSMDKLFQLAEKNGFRVERFVEEVKNPHVRGRVRMIIGNQLRGKMKRDGFIVGLTDEKIEDEDFNT